jgi:hypothetical protein
VFVVDTWSLLLLLLLLLDPCQLAATNLSFLHQLSCRPGRLLSSLAAVFPAAAAVPTLKADAAPP